MNDDHCKISITNWEKYQARADKPLSWFKLWGGIFMEHWMQAMSPKRRYAVLAMMDFARGSRNSMTLFYSTFNRQYGLRMRSKDIKEFVLHLISIGFLSDQSLTKGGLERKKEREERQDFASLSDGNGQEKTKAEERYERLTGKKIHG